MQTLAEFLLARIASDERAAHHVFGQPVPCGSDYIYDTVQAEVMDVPVDGLIVSRVRMVTECTAKREIIASGVSDDVLKWLALPYEEHPDYRPEWRPVDAPPAPPRERAWSATV